METTRITKREMKLTILRLIATYQGKSVSKYNFIGRAPFEGDLCREFKEAPTNAEKQLAGRAWDELVISGHLEIDYGQLVREGSNCFLADKGRYALEKGALDDFDSALLGINSYLVQLRDGFYEAILSHSANSVQQAANSGREFLNQTLRCMAPEEEVVKEKWFEPDGDSKHRLGVNQGHRIRFALDKCSILDEDDREFCRASLKRAGKAFQGGAHATKEPQSQKIRDAMVVVELVFKLMLKIG
jgi:hypothetical protein